MSHVSIDSRDFDFDKLSGEARQQAMNINLVEQEMRRLHAQLKIRQTAGNADRPAEAAAEGPEKRKAKVL